MCSWAPLPQSQIRGGDGANSGNAWRAPPPLCPAAVPGGGGGLPTCCLFSKATCISGSWRRRDPRHTTEGLAASPHQAVAVREREGGGNGLNDMPASSETPPHYTEGSTQRPANVSQPHQETLQEEAKGLPGLWHFPCSERPISCFAGGSRAAEGSLASLKGL